MDKFSVLMTIYKSDKAEYFDLSLNSVLNQTLAPDEIVLVKDGPIPKSIQEIIDRKKKEFPELIVECEILENVGLGLALNKGLRICSNDLVARMDSDDISLPNRFEKQIEIFHKRPWVDIVGSQVKEFDGNPDNIVSERNVPCCNADIKEFAKRRDPFNHPSVVFKKFKVEKFGPYKDFRKNQDTALWIDLLHNGCIGENSPEYLLLFRFNENTFKKRKSWINTWTIIKIRWYSFTIGFSSIYDFGLALIGQLLIFILPFSFQKFFYKSVLRGKAIS